MKSSIRIDQLLQTFHCLQWIRHSLLSLDNSLSLLRSSRKTVFPSQSHTFHANTRSFSCCTRIHGLGCCTRCASEGTSEWHNSGLLWSIEGIWGRYLHKVVRSIVYQNNDILQLLLGKIVINWCLDIAIQNSRNSTLLRTLSLGWSWKESILMANPLVER